MGKMAYWEYFEKIHVLLKGPPPTLKVPGLPATPLRKNSHESLNLSLHANPSIHKYVSNFGLV